MRFEHSMRGQSVAINYGTNPMGEVAGVWVELADGGRADLTPLEELAARRLAVAHHEAQLQASGAVPALMPLPAAVSPLFWPVAALNDDALVQALQALHQSVIKKPNSSAMFTKSIALLGAVDHAVRKSTEAFEEARKDGVLLYAWRGSRALLQALPARLAREAA